jgi:hypothetical protein
MAMCAPTAHICFSLAILRIVFMYVLTCFNQISRFATSSFRLSFWSRRVPVSVLSGVPLTPIHWPRARLFQSWRSGRRLELASLTTRSRCRQGPSELPCLNSSTRSHLRSATRAPFRGPFGHFGALIFVSLFCHPEHSRAQLVQSALQGRRLPFVDVNPTIDGGLLRPNGFFFFPCF